MKMRMMLTIAAAGLLLTGIAAAEDYDFFSGARYPGPVQKPGVDLYKVAKDGGADPSAYGRREVVWWPRKGVDVIEIKEAMPLRTWTLRDRQMNPKATIVDAKLGIEELTRRIPSDQPKQFKAHLVGFRGLGNSYGDPYSVPRDYFCPAVVLRMEDGTKRCFTRGTFIEEDERWILDLYKKEMARIRKTLCKVDYTLRGGNGESTEPGQPGTMRVQSEHFMWISGSQAPPGERNPWVDIKQPEKTRLYREGAVEFGENLWAYQEYAGMLMPYWDRHQQHKYEVTVCGTYRDGNTYIGGYAGGGYGGCGIKDAGGGPWSMLLAHEWGHGVPLQINVTGGGGEILADACALIDDPAGVERLANNAKRPWRTCIHGAYRTGMFYAIMGDDPNWGYCMVITLPLGEGEPSIFHTVARVGEDRGLFKKGIRGVGDMMGEFAARQAELDCELRDGARRHFMSVKRNYLEAVDRQAGIYRIPWAEAPEPFGANIIRLVPEKHAKKIAVDFRGFFDPDTYSDWRVCIVAVDAQGKARYSPLWNKGLMEMEIKPGDRRFWLTVAGMPYALPKMRRHGNIGILFNGRHAYQYPYEVKLAGCRPGTPHNMPGDTDDYELTHLGEDRMRGTASLCTIPNPGDTPEAERLSETLPKLRAKVDAFKEGTEKLIAEGKISQGYWYSRRFVPHLEFIDQYVDQMIDGIKGHRHENGGGWVADSAEVADTAYVGPDAMVLDGAKVLGNAAIEDFAVLRGPEAVISGNAKLSGQAHVMGNVKIDGYTRVAHPITAKDELVMTDQMPLRPVQKPGESGKLWANYAMDRDETVVLEDWYRHRNTHTTVYMFDILNLNGHLQGKPEFEVDGPRRGFRFDGQSQYAEAAPAVADLGQITVAVALKWDGGANQVVFDFGSSLDNRFTLSPQGTSGKAELAVTVGGKTEVIAADVALPKGKWTECRVEIDGKKIALWIDSRKAAERASGFRPADAFPAGAEKRNFIAAARDLSSCFKGTIDHLRVYHKVHEDFDAVPEPRQHSSRRVCLDFIDSTKPKYAGGNRLVEELIKAKIALDYGSYYQQIGGKLGKRRGEIEGKPPVMADDKSEELQALESKAGELQRELDTRRKELVAEFDKLPATIKAREDAKNLEERARSLQKERNELAATLRKELEAKHKVEPKPPTAEEKAKMAENDNVLAKAQKKKEAAKAELDKVEKSLADMPEIVKLRTAIDNPEKAPGTDVGKLQAQLNYRLAELRVNTPEYVRWWRLSEAGPPRLPHRIEQKPGPNIHAMVATNPQIVKLDAEIRQCQSKAKALRPDSRSYVSRGTAELAKRVAKAKMEVGQVKKTGYTRNALERNWLISLGWQYNSGFYNKPYRSYFDDLARAAVGREDQECHEDFGQLESIYNMQTATQWHTECDWETRLKQEIDGTIEGLPLLKKWLERSRGKDNK